MNYVHVPKRAYYDMTSEDARQVENEARKMADDAGLAHGEVPLRHVFAKVFRLGLVELYAREKAITKAKK